MKTAFLFAGQGSQFTGMGKSLLGNSPAAKKIFDIAERLRPGTPEQCFTADKEILSQTVNTQPCVYTVSLAAAEALREMGIIPSAAAGFSLGEMPAAAFAGVFTPEEGFALTVRRALWMDEAAAEKPGGMAAVLKLKPEEINDLCEKIGDVWAVNYNSPSQTVAAGGVQAIEALCDEVRSRRGKAVILPVSGAFHSPYMKPAGENMLRALSGMKLDSPYIPLYANATAQIYEPGGIPETLSRQIYSPVLFTQTILNMNAAGIDTFIEVGPGKTLTGLVSRIIPEAVIYNVCEYSEAEEIAKILL